MLNDVWMKIAQFLGTLNGENINRESYVHTPEYDKALEEWKETEQEWEAFLETLSDGQRETAEDMKECLEDFASAQEKRAYIQGEEERPGYRRLNKMNQGFVAKYQAGSCNSTLFQWFSFRPV